MASTSKRSNGAGTNGSDDALLRAAVLDALHLSEKRSAPRFLGFLDERQRALVQAVLNREKTEHFLFYGGYSDAERTYLGIFPDGDEPQEAEFPIAALSFRYREGVRLNHRDFLGTLLSCGVKRETVGDILCSDGLTVAFIEKDIARFLEGQITKVGGEGVSVVPDFKDELPVAHTFHEIRDTVASPRLDAVLKAAAGISREEAARRIEAGQVAVNHVPCLSVSRTIKEKDVLSVRGVGRFNVDVIGPESKKGRLFITIQKYQ